MVDFSQIDNLLIKGQLDKVLESIDKIEEENKNLDQSSLKHWLTLYRYRVDIKQEKYLETIENLEILLRKVREEKKDTILELQINLSIIDIYQILNNVDVAFEKLQTIEPIINENSDDNNFIRVKAKFNEFFADYLFRIGDTERAIERATDAKSIYAQTGKELNLAEVSNKLGAYYFQFGDHDASLSHFRAAFQIFVSNNMNYHQSVALGNIGTIYHVKGQIKMALEYYEQCYLIRKESGTPRQLINVLNNIGQAQMLRGKYNLAEKYFNECLDICSSSNMIQERAVTLQNLGDLYRQKHNIKKAEDTYLQCLSIFKEKKLVFRLAEILSALVYLNVEENKLVKAKNYFQELYELLGEKQEKLFKHLLLNSEAMILFSEDKREDSKEKFLQVMQDDVAFYQNNFFAGLKLIKIELSLSQQREDLDTFFTNIDRIIEDLYLIAKNQKSPLLLFFVNLLKIKYYYILMRFDLIEHFLKEMREYLVEFDSQKFNDIVEKEEELYHILRQNYQNFAKGKDNKIKLIEESKIKETVEFLSSLIH